MAMVRGPADATLEKLNRIFGQEYFEQGRLVITVARDLPGVTKVGVKLQSRITERYGAIVEVFMEYVKHALWVKLHEATTVIGVQKGEEDPSAAVTAVPEGVRQHPYKRPQMPTLEVLLLWEDKTGTTRGHCLFSAGYPDVLGENDVDRVFAEIQPFFAKRWITVQLKLAAPIRGEFEEPDDAEKPLHDTHVGAGALVTIVACHAVGHALQADGIPRRAEHVAECRPMCFKSVTDDAGVAKLCFLPAEVNRLQVGETDSFRGYDGALPSSVLSGLDQGPTVIAVELTPKAIAGLVVQVFALPATIPVDEDSALLQDGIIDWENEDKEMLAAASVDVTPLEAGANTVPAMRRGEDGVFELCGLPEGCVTMAIHCPGYVSEEKTMMLLAGANAFYVPLKAA